MQAVPLSPENLTIKAEKAENITWHGEPALWLENGLALLPEQSYQDGMIAVRIAVEGPAYPGIAFRVTDSTNYELAYAVPHVSGQWDALQYDPIFHGSNTWQIYCGPGFQGAASLPTGDWFDLRLAFQGDRAMLQVGSQPPLVVPRLAHSSAAGQIGLWTYRPAYFTAFACAADPGEIPVGEPPAAPEGSLMEWAASGVGRLACETHGVLNLNRYLRVSEELVRLSRRFRLAQSGLVVFEFGFSDHLVLELDGEAIFSGEHKFQGFTDRASRGYAELGCQRLAISVAAGEHELAAGVRVSEPFGWGLALAVHAGGLEWLSL